MSMVATSALAPLALTAAALAAGAVLVASLRGFAALWRALDAELAQAHAARVNVVVSLRPTGAWTAYRRPLADGSLGLATGCEVVALNRSEEFDPVPCGRAAA
jgi:hypothetical protein